MSNTPTTTTVRTVGARVRFKDTAAVPPRLVGTLGTVTQWGFSANLGHWVVVRADNGGIILSDLSERDVELEVTR